MSQSGTFLVLANPNIATKYVTNDGFAIPSVNVLNIVGLDSVTTSASGSTITVKLAGVTKNAVQYGGVDNALENTNIGVDGAILIGANNAAPVFNVPTSSDNSITITTGVNTLDFKVGVPGVITIWNEVNSNTTMAVNKGYISTNEGVQVVLTLPSTCAQGDIIEVVDNTSGGYGWRVKPNTGQTIGNANVILNAPNGYIQMEQNKGRRFNRVKFLCVTANTRWIITSSRGNNTFNEG